MFTERLFVDPCLECSNLWRGSPRGPEPPCIQLDRLGPDGLMTVEMGEIGGNGICCCPCIISWDEVVAYATGAEKATMNADAEILMREIRECIGGDPDAIRDPQRASFIEGQSRGNYFSHYVAHLRRGIFHFVRRLPEEQYLQLLQFRKENALDVNWSDWRSKLEAAVWMAGLRVRLRSPQGTAGLFSAHNIGIVTGCIAVLFSPDGVSAATGQTILAAVGFGSLALPLAQKFEEFGCDVVDAVSSEELGEAAELLAEIVTMSNSKVGLFLSAGVERWTTAAAEAHSMPVAATAPVARAPKRDRLRVIEGGSRGNSRMPLKVAKAMVQRVLHHVINSTSRTVTSATIVDLDRALAGDGFRLIKAEPWGPDGGLQLFYQNGNVLARFKTMGDKAGPRANQPHFTIGYNDAKGLDWQNDMAKFDAEGNVVAKVITDPAKFNPVDHQGNPQKFVLLPTNFDIGAVEQWAARTHFNTTPGFSLEGLEAILARAER